MEGFSTRQRKMWLYRWIVRIPLTEQGDIKDIQIEIRSRKDAHLISESEGWIRMHKLLGRTAWEILYGEQVWAYYEILDWII